MKSWKTTLYGLIASAGIAMTSSLNPVLHVSGVIISAVATALLGNAAKDAHLSDTPLSK